jgi:XTP/dITP diphosphohydrolase
MVLWFLTGNKGKLHEASTLFSEFNIEVKQLKAEIIEPQSDDIEEVAKAKMVQALSHLPDENDLLLVEDAGLFVDSLNGFPGVFSSYALQTIGCEGILRLMGHLQSDDPVQDSHLRKAEFQAVAVLHIAGETLVARGVCPGRIAHQPSVGEGFGFDPIFIPCDLDSLGEALGPGELGETSTHGLPFGAIEQEQKNLFSHRARALSSLVAMMDERRENLK